MPIRGEPVAAQSLAPQFRTTLVEKFLLVTAMMVLPLDNYIPTVAGMSVSFLMFGLLAAYVIVNRPRTLGKIWYHPAFIAAYAFICVSALLEFSSPLSRYGDLIRFAQMIGGAVCVAVICRDRSALVAGLYGYIATALWVSVVLFSMGYGTLQGMQADDFDEASHLRSQTFDKPLGNSINALAFISAQGAIVAFALSLSDRLKYLRVPLLGVGGFCLIASFLPMSRGVAGVIFVSFVTILYAQGFRYGKALVLVSILGMGVYMMLPDAIWSRMVVSVEVGKGGKRESRVQLYDTALDRLPEYILAGVGAGNYFGKWGLEKGFARHRGGVTVAHGVHNSYLAITIYWGVLGLSMFLWIAWCVYHSIPLRCGRDELSLALLGILVSIGLWLGQVHGFYDKPSAFALGMIVGARQWIWPMGIVSEVVVKERPLAPISQ